MTHAEIFDDIYRTNFWGGSGGGSREEVAWPFAAYASQLILCGRGELSNGTVEAGRVKKDFADHVVAAIFVGGFALLYWLTQLIGKALR